MEETGRLNLMKMEILVRELADLHNQGKEVIVVSSGAIAVGRSAMGIDHKPRELAEKTGMCSNGQARLMMIYKNCCRIQSDSSTDFDDQNIR